MKETEIVRACLDYLRLRGVFAWRQNAGVIPVAGGGFRRFSGMLGQSDIVGILRDTDGHGRFLAIEVKRPGKKPSEAQQQFLDRVTEEGGVALWVTSVDELQRDLDQVLTA